ncbi:MAG: 3-hydroxyacyl-[acyl-carrier-protein] dehydratase FabZ [Steroidobacteraceae bacterium]|nr:3-hydroxyacyl-[acyl-carrier-protein] dehydratase FabZ [Steroidobacteraceae bacterium]
MTDPAFMDIAGILRRLPHRYPFLLVDRVLACEPGKSIRAVKNVTCNEPQFTGHFPDRPVMPGVLIIEALAQAAGLLAFVTVDASPGDHAGLYLVGVDEARFRSPVEPGDQLILTAEVERAFKGIWRFSAVALVGDREAATARIMVAAETKAAKA